MTFKEKLVRLRKLKGLTQDEFASAVGVSRQAVYKWESGQSYPEVAKLLEIKVLFNISIDDLLDDNYEVILPEKKRKRAKKEVNTEAEAALNNEPASVIEEAIPSGVPAAESVTAVSAPTEISEPAGEETAASPSAEPVAAESEAAEEEGKKKVSFFGRIFGRK